MKKICAFFYKTPAGSEPVRDWLLSLSAEDRKLIGDDIRTAEFGWPVGMPICRHIEAGIYEIRTILQDRIARVLFSVEDGNMYLLHGFIKKTQKTHRNDIDLAKKRKKQLEGENGR